MAIHQWSDPRTPSNPRSILGGTGIKPRPSSCSAKIASIIAPSTPTITATNRYAYTGISLSPFWLSGAGSRSLASAACAWLLPHRTPWALPPCMLLGDSDSNRDLDGHPPCADVTPSPFAVRLPSSLNTSQSYLLAGVLTGLNPPAFSSPCLAPTSAASIYNPWPGAILPWTATHFVASFPSADQAARRVASLFRHQGLVAIWFLSGAAGNKSPQKRLCLWMPLPTAPSASWPLGLASCLRPKRFKSLSPFRETSDIANPRPTNGPIQARVCCP